MALSLHDDVIKTLFQQLHLYAYTGHLWKSFDSKKTQIKDLIKETAEICESNSAVVIGSHGSGKSALMDYVLRDILQDPTIEENLLCVNLNGFIHEDDTNALKDIAQQMSLDGEEIDSSDSFSAGLSKLLSAVKSDEDAYKSVLFVLSDLEAFMMKENTILKSLFNFEQFLETSICVIGLCSEPGSLQVLESLLAPGVSYEKINLSEEVSFEEFEDATKYFLSLHLFQDVEFQQKWNSEINNLLGDSTVQDILYRYFQTNNSMGDLKHFLKYAILNMDRLELKLAVDDFEFAFMKCKENYKLNVISGLSDVEISLVITMFHIVSTNGYKPFSFEVVYNQFITFFNDRLKIKMPRSAVEKSFNNLVMLEVVKPSGDYIPYELQKFILVNPDEVKEMMNGCPDRLDEFEEWAGLPVNS